MRLLERLNNVPSTYLKKLEATDGIWEIRAQESSMAFRILGFFEGNYFIATNGFIKKTQKTPSNEIRTAGKRKQEYLLRGK